MYLPAGFCAQVPDMTSSLVRGPESPQLCARRFTYVCRPAHARGAKSETNFFSILKGCFSYYTPMIQRKSTGVQVPEALCFISREYGGYRLIIHIYRDN